MYSTALAEIVLVVKNLKTSTDFYRKVVGLKLRPEGTNPKWSWFYAGEPSAGQSLALTTHRPLLFEEKSPLPPDRRWGPIHYALNVPRQNLDRAVQNVRSHKVEVYGPVEFDWMHAAAYYFYDPDGNLVEFWSPDE